jgi:hypothetical protein
VDSTYNLSTASVPLCVYEKLQEAPYSFVVVCSCVDFSQNQLLGSRGVDVITSV